MRLRHNNYFIAKGIPMKKRLQALLFALALTSTSSILHAEGSIDAGKEKAALCFSCHGENGNSLVSNFPKLAQQNSSYLVKQLQAYKNGTRKNAMMSGIVAGLSDDDMSDIAAYFADQDISSNQLPNLDDDEDENKKDIHAIMAQGSDLYRNGDLPREVSACIACHGPFGEGNKPATFPSIKSQHADYLIQTLTDFKTGARSNNPENMMHMIAKKMTDDEIKAVSYHISMMK